MSHSNRVFSIFGDVSTTFRHCLSFLLLVYFGILSLSADRGDTTFTKPRRNRPVFTLVEDAEDIKIIIVADKRWQRYAKHTESESSGDH
jgi:hypothetical protein